MGSINCFVSVGFVCGRSLILSPIRVTKVSRKGMPESLCSIVNLIVACWVFSHLMNSCSSSSDALTMQNISSIYLFQVLIFIGAWANIFSSNWAMKMQAYPGAIRDPMAVPDF